jgi:hypothetical protein
LIQIKQGADDVTTMFDYGSPRRYRGRSSGGPGDTHKVRLGRVGGDHTRPA